jgi:hypothetical protein
MAAIYAIDAIALAKRGRKLLRQGRITHRQLTILDCLLWCCRDRTGRITVSYSALCRLCHVARDTVAGALTALQRLGLLSRIKRRVRIAWHQGGSASRQAVSSYVLHDRTQHDHTESAGQTVIENDRTQITPTPYQAAQAQRALKAIGRRRGAVLTAMWQARGQARPV